jgi:hypothetical protein
VLDLDRDALADEIERARGRLAVDFIDAAAWGAMRRLAAAGLLRFTHEARTLHRAAALAEEPGEAKPDNGRAAMGAAERALKMARVLAAGGFPEEAPPLLAKSLRSIALALSAKDGLAIADVGADGDIRRLIEEAALPSEALAILDAAEPGAPLADASGVEPLIACAARILATVRRNEPRLAMREAA